MNQGPTFALRPANTADSALFYQVICETMRDFVLETWGAWDDARVRAESIEDASSANASVILIHGEPAGVITVERYADHIQLEQLYLLKQFQRIGIGTLLMQALLQEAAAARSPIRLRVLRVNPAKKFYERLGFVITKQTAERIYMEYPA